MDAKIRNKSRGMNKKGQVTIFIILALILIVSIVLIFVLRKGPEIQVISEENPQAYIEGCVKDSVEEALEIIMVNAGDLEPKKTTSYNGGNLTYLCYTNLFYSKCINQKPLLVDHIEDQITEYIKPRISNCFQILEQDLEEKYDVQMGADWDLTTRLTSKTVEVEIDREFKMQRGDNIQIFNFFKARIIHPIYGLAEVAMEIANQEASYCNFDILGFMIIYPEYQISKFRTGNSDTIYTIEKARDNKEFKFAVRSCVIPPGM